MNQDTIAVIARHYIPTLSLVKQVGSECAVDGTIAVKLVIERSDSPHRQEAVLILLGNYTDHDDLIMEVTGGQRAVGIYLAGGQIADPDSTEPDILHRAIYKYGYRQYCLYQVV